MTAALLRWWTVPRLNGHSNPSSTRESSTAKNPIARLTNTQRWRPSADSIPFSKLKLSWLEKPQSSWGLTKQHHPFIETKLIKNFGLEKQLRKVASDPSEYSWTTFWCRKFSSDGQNFELNIQYWHSRLLVESRRSYRPTAPGSILSITKTFRKFLMVLLLRAVAW